MSKLQELREEINTIDESLTKLFEKRMEIALKIAKYKKENDIPILNKKREDEVIKKNVQYLKNKDLEVSLEKFFKCTMEISREVQGSDMLQQPLNFVKLYGLLGGKLGHSFSPKIHSAIFKEIKENGQYHLFSVEDMKVGDAIEGLKNLDIKGLNVTIPYKVQVMDYLDEVSEEAIKIGAINTICFKDKNLIGYNTDYYGFGMMLRKFYIDSTDKVAVILGTGGAARAVVEYLKDNGIRKVILVSRDKEESKKKFEGLSVINYEELKRVKNADILVNCTPCGMHPNIDNSPINKKLVGKFNVVIDLIYNPQETLLMKYAKEKNIKAINGLYMLVGQAVKSQELWNDIKIDDDVVDEIYEKLKRGDRYV